ncbi:MAG TPA: alanine racemase [Acidobacteriaceae bacterium]|nr:alanine racemase [Acidobacteriaceae bacterium]
MKSWIEISESRLRSNVSAIRAAAGEGANVLAVIKADGYGHGAELLAPVLVDAGVTWLGVADAEEGAQIRRALGQHDRTRASTRHSPGPPHDVRILVMCGIEPGDADRIVEKRLTPVVWTPGHVQALEAAAERARRRVAVHLEIDTGMARQGAVPESDGEPALERVVDALHRSKWLRMEGVFSHLSSSEVRHGHKTAAQLERLQRAFDLLKTEDGEVLLPEWIHVANSSALDEGSTTEWIHHIGAAMRAGVLVRPGLALYGYCLGLENENGGLLRPVTAPGGLCPQLQPVLTWKTHILATREIAPGQTVGYGATFIAERPMRLALLPVGYADGFRREASSSIGNGWVMVAGKRAAVVGRVSMNLTVVDVTEIAQASEGGEVTLLGEGVTAEDHARWCETISYEILCGIRAERRLV